MGLGACARHNVRAAGESLAAACELTAKQRALLALHPPLDPIDEQGKATAARREAERQRRAEKNQEKATLARVARAYHEKHIEPRTTSEGSADWINSLENHVPPVLWHKPIAEITRAELLEFLRDIQGRMADTAQRVRRRLDETFEEAIELGIVSVNPVAMLRTKLRREHKPGRRTPFRALAYSKVPALIERLRIQLGTVARCLEFTICTAARMGEAIGARWCELDLDAALWTVPGERMKAGEPHVVHLSERVIAILADMRVLATPYVFPSVIDTNRPISNVAMLMLLKRMGHTGVTVHGFRSAFSTWANEQGIARPDVIESWRLRWYCLRTSRSASSAPLRSYLMG